MNVPQGSNSGGVIHKKNESITVTSSFSTLFSIDMESVADGVIVINNSDATKTLDYKIYASPDNTNTIPADNHSSWVNILDLSSDPNLYDINKLKTIPVSTSFYESLSNKWKWFRIELKTSSGTLTAKVYFRGRT